MTEEWKLWKPGFTNKNGNYYEPIYISNMGNIMGRKLQLDTNGYFNFIYQGKKYRLHRIVAELFINNPDDKPYIDHINTVRTDNRVENLRWCTQKENMNNPTTKKNLSKAACKKIQCIETGEIFDGAIFIRNNKNDSYHMKEYINKNWKVAGYHWRYVDDGTNF